ANSSEPWKIPDAETLQRAPVKYAKRKDFGEEGFKPYQRRADTLARPWATPGEPGLEHRIGGLTKQAVTGDVVYDPESHAEMVQLRQEKVARVVADVPNVEVDGPDSGDLLVLGWGSTNGAITAAVNETREAGQPVSRVHIRHMNPLPANLGDVLRNFKRVLLPELNLGQLSMLLRAKYLVDIESLPKVAGQPFRVTEIRTAIDNILSTSSKED
ncbi:MAG: 2-oxoglutarate ferredoxin oxidoreductase subunit alpha, partial [bacterium]|nr:2-oxoglutarate ferredoxin oxidoreductase subunit alpha [bacterium]